MGGNGKDDDDKSGSLDDQWGRMLKDQHDKFWANVETERQRLAKTLNDDNNDSNSPFRAFKEFIDSNINHLADSFKQLPSNIRELRANMQREQQRMQEEELDVSRRWTGSEDTPDHIDLMKARSTDKERRDAMDATILLLEESQRRNAHIPNEKIEALYKDDGGTSGQLDGLSMGNTSYGARWLSVDWFKRNPYSPIRLEAHPDLAMYGSQWRAAFEDLMDATLDKPMGSVERVGMRSLYGKPQSTYYGPGLEWLLSLQCRGILPPLLPRIMNNERARHHLRGLGDSRLRGVADGSIVDIIKLAKEDLQWKSTSTSDWMKSNLYADISDLVSEVATKATADYEAEPIAYGITPADEMELAEHVMQYSCSTNAPRLASVSHSEQGRSYTSTLTEEDDEDDDDDEDLALQEAAAMVAEVKQEQREESRVLLEFLDTLMNGTLGYDEKMEELEGLLQHARALDLDDAEELASLIEELRTRQLARETRANGSQRQKENAVVQQKPEILSALTTTETTRLPDGTVTTKVVLKKRFADGREETSESVHTSKEDLGHSQQERSKDESEQPKKTGWFWS